MSELAVYEHARDALAEAVRFDEVTRIHSAARQAEAYARIAKDKKLQADAAEIVARAERKLGILLRKAKGEGQLSQGGRPANSNLTEPETGADAEPVFDNSPFTLSDIGVDKKLSSRAQKAAALEDDAFEEAVSAEREKILSDAAPVVSAPRVRTIKADKPKPVEALEPRKFHQFAFSVLAMSLKAETVKSEVVHFFARQCGVLDETNEFSPEAIKAMGNLAAVALRAAGEDETTGGLPVAAASVTAEETGRHSGAANAAEPERPGAGVTAGETATHFLEKSRLREAYEGEVALLAPQKGKLTKQTAEAAMRAGYAAEVPLAIMSQDLGHPHGMLATWANRLGLTSAARMHANQKRFGGEA